MAWGPVHQVQKVPAVVAVVAVEVPAGDPVALAQAAPAPAAINKRITEGGLTYWINFPNTPIFHCFTKQWSSDMYPIVYNRSGFSTRRYLFSKNFSHFLSFSYSLLKNVK
ncbi:MAG: hypothetical protein JRF60_07980 [Deltaproteobacteria bacterium]|nr:hypothetical protein [Deltaproteobacteria bacterium]